MSANVEIVRYVCAGRVQFVGCKLMCIRCNDIWVFPYLGRVRWWIPPYPGFRTQRQSCSSITVASRLSGTSRFELASGSASEHRSEATTLYGMPSLSSGTCTYQPSRPRPRRAIRISSAGRASLVQVRQTERPSTRSIAQPGDVLQQFLGLAGPVGVGRRRALVRRQVGDRDGGDAGSAGALVVDDAGRLQVDSFVEAQRVLVPVVFEQPAVHGGEGVGEVAQQRVQLGAGAPVPCAASRGRRWGWRPWRSSPAACRAPRSRLPASGRTCRYSAGLSS